MGTKQKKPTILSVLDTLVNKFDFKSLSGPAKTNVMITFIIALVAILLVTPTIFACIENIVSLILNTIVKLVLRPENSSAQSATQVSQSSPFLTSIIAFVVIAVEAIACKIYCYIAEKKTGNGS